MFDEETQNQEVDEQKKYLVTKIDELLEGVGPGYGESLMEELIARLERTVAHFHEEVTELLETLKERSSEQEKKLKEMWDNDISPQQSTVVEEKLSDAEIEISDWELQLEKKIAKRKLKGESSKTESQKKEKSEKRRFLRGKKK